MLRGRELFPFRINKVLKRAVAEHRQAVLTCLVALVLSGPALALNPDRSLGQYARHAWSLEDGLPQATVTAIVQGRDQYLYIATFGGLLRFDGIRFESVPDGGGCGNRFGSLAVDAHGTLWAGISRGGLCRVEGQGTRQRLLPFEASNSIVINGINELVPRAGGGVWVSSSEGLFEVDGEQAIPFDESHGLPSRLLTGLTPGLDKDLWVLTDSGLCRFSNRRCHAPEWSSRFDADKLTVGLQTRDGTLFLGRQDDFFRVTDDRVERIDLPDHLGMVTALFEDRQGNLWLGTSRAGIKRLSPRPGLALMPGETRRRARSIAQDSENNLWVGYGGDGLERLSDGRAYPVHVPDPIQRLDVLAVENDPRGGVWVAAPCAGLVSVRADAITVVDTQDDLGTGCLWALRSEPDGRLWIGTYGEGLAQRSPDGELRLMNGPPTRERIVRALSRDTVTGELLVGSDQGVYRVDEQSEGFHLIDGTEALDVHYLTTTADGTIWIGSRTGATRIGEQIQHFGQEQGLANDYVRAIKIDPDGVVWLGTYGGGLHRLAENKMVRYGPAEGLPDIVVSRIVEDAQQRFWMTGNLGVVRVARRELEAVARGEIEAVNAQLFDERDGMPIRETNGGGQPAGLLRANGEFWVPTIDGLAVFDTQRPDQALGPPPVRIERALLDGEMLDTRGPILLPAGARNLEIHYTAPAFRAPEQVRFRYRLEGFDSRWTLAGDRRTAYFPIIPPGEFEFRVTAAQRSGDWNPDGAGLTIRMPPTFVQSAWFIPLLVLAVAALVMLMFWLRVRTLRQREKALKLEVRKRTAELERLASLDGLTGIANRRSFDARLEREWNARHRRATPLSVLLIDVDHFKAYNDHYGHLAGDDCLKKIGRTLEGCLPRDSGLLARIGGEEFGVILAETTAEDGRRIAERLRRTIADLAIPHEAARAATIVTVSIGGATALPGRSTSREALFEAADQALYSAKSDGRNRVRFNGHGP